MIQDFAYWSITISGRPFHAVPLSLIIPHRGPTTPHPPKWIRFGLFRVRSPLLTESQLISFPGGTEMFHFPPFASCTYLFSTR